MVSSNNSKQLTEREEEILASIRESLLEDPRVRQIAGHASASAALDGHDKSLEEESDRADETTMTDPLIKLPRREMGENDNELISSPSIAPTEPSIEPNPQSRPRETSETSGRRPSVARRLARTSVLGIFVIAIVGAGLAVPYHELQVEKVVAGAAHYLASTALMPVRGTSSSQGPQSTFANSKPSDAQPIENAATLALGTASSAKSGETESRDLADVRRLLTQLVAGQEQLRQDIAKLVARQDQMGQDITALQAAERNVDQQISSLAVPPTVRTPARKRMRSRRVKPASPQAQ